jgi:hypothetical protein
LYLSGLIVPVSGEKVKEKQKAAQASIPAQQSVSTAIPEFNFSK